MFQKKRLKELEARLNRIETALSALRKNEDERREREEKEREEREKTPSFKQIVDEWINGANDERAE